MYFQYTLVRFDPITERFQSSAIPSGGIYTGIVRHMRPTREGDLLIHQSSTNRIMLVSLKPPTLGNKASVQIWGERCSRTGMHTTRGLTQSCRIYI